MAERKSTWFLLGQAAGGGGEAAKGFKLGWQYSGYDAVARAINEPRGGTAAKEDGLSNGISLDRSGNVSITDAIKNTSDQLMHVGVIFVFQWNNPAMCLGGKFDWIGHGGSEGEYHDLNRQNIVHKLEDPVGKTKQQNYWYENGAKPGPYIVSKLLKRTSGVGGAIVTIGDGGVFWKTYRWSAIEG